MTAETLWRFRSSAFPEDRPPSDAADRTSGTAQWTRAHGLGVASQAKGV